MLCKNVHIENSLFLSCFPPSKLFSRDIRCATMNGKSAKRTGHMKHWFAPEVTNSFDIFSASHFTMVSIYFIVLLYFFLAYKPLLNQKRLYTFTKWTLFTLLLVSELGYTTWALSTNTWNMREHAPLHLCGIAGIIGMIAILSNSKKMIQILYFIGIIPAFIALLTPELIYGFPHFRFWKFFVHHMTISLTGVFLVLTSQVSITFRSMVETYAYLNVYAVFAFFLNMVIGANYLYLSDTPTVNSPLDLLGSGVWYYINLELLCIGVFLCMYFLYKIVERISRSTHPTFSHDKKISS
ncbi:TIGR02206 family membrane protein [Pontibacillus yanchengensis]|uniref:TIGR02206 family membrane protein n=2 Tax=Pontibacillus yanchengensis TaxID=462910 RepID=A0A6I5A676_9BACI|nr:TIGR02206 family membrane protein [Pontibacillus yanchengensis]